MRRARHEEFTALLDGVPNTPCQVGVDIVLALLIIPLGFIISAFGFRQCLPQFLGLDLVLGVILILPQKGFGLRCDGSLLVFLVLLVHKITGKTPPQELHIPFLLTIHTLGNNGVLNEVFLNALVAHLMLAVEALDLLVGILVEFLDTNSAFHICWAFEKHS